MNRLFRRLLTISRPRFWIYLLGPLLLGWTADNSLWHKLTSTNILLFVFILFFFSFPANLFLYGINDLYDEETDRLNPKKHGYEQMLTGGIKSSVTKSALVIIFIAAIYLAALHFTTTKKQVIEAFIGLFGFFFLGWQYSATPIRAKARPFLDSLFNGLYLFPAFVGHALNPCPTLLPWQAIMSGWLWCMAMHAYSAVPDIEADRQAHTHTIATSLGKEKTLAVCAVLYLFACVISFSLLHLLSFIYGAIYLVLMMITWRQTTPEKTFAVYRVFPWINTLVGFSLWIWIITRFR